MRDSEKLKSLLASLIVEGETLLETKWQPVGRYVGGPPTYVDLEKFQKWRSSCRLVLLLLGNYADTWKDILDGQSHNTLGNALSTLGTLKAINDAVEHGYLIRYEQLIYAEAFSDLHEQAEHLLEQGYVVAAGVLLRATLEQKLKLLCNKSELIIEKDRPTISDYNNALYKGTIYDKLILKNVDAMAAIGNHAAHANQDLKKEDVLRLLRDVTDFISRF